MVAIAQKKNRNHINKGKVKIHLGDFDEVRFDDNWFDKIFSVNTIYFWKNPDTTISKICRILKPEGKLFIGFHDKSEMEEMPLNRDVFQYYSANFPILSCSSIRVHVFLIHSARLLMFAAPAHLPDDFFPV